MNLHSEARLTILMPLHQAARWVDTISTTIDRSPAASRLIISDITQVDDALQLLEDRHLGDERITFRRDAGVADWRVHANKLLSLVETEFFSIMPQDDEFYPGYYEELIAALDARPSAGLAFGGIDKLDMQRMEMTRMERVPCELGVKPPWREAIHLDLHWNLGIPYRGVVRREFNRPLPMFPHDYADQIWVFSIALSTYLVEVPSAIYLKRYHDTNTHHTWKPLIGDRRLEILLHEIDTQLASQPAERRAARRKLIQIYRERE
ncbi:glycosyltransferase family 2 protein [Gimesia panareensis]|uniref:glycosyltransferase family 2 protein n=1 Tax=Gimesia panareensis TaxID=2527978 RepID=UPI00118C708E|nr:glycosyltransferase family 2 protein [Gimesia panareensis]QDU49029.1 hypothetical protein Pan110_13460 [Gimesia panareensis]